MTRAFIGSTIMHICISNCLWVNFEGCFYIWNHKIQYVSSDCYISVLNMLFASMFNSLRPRPNRRHFADDTFKHIFLNENVRIWIKISLKFVPKGPINNNPALVQIMAWRRSGDKPFSETMMVSLPMHICVTWPQWVKWLTYTKWLLM